MNWTKSMNEKYNKIFPYYNMHSIDLIKFLINTFANELAIISFANKEKKRQ